MPLAGARGGGKSWAVRVKAALLCLRYPGIKTLIVRRTYKELQNNHIEQLRGMLHGSRAITSRTSYSPSATAAPSPLATARVTATWTNTRARSMTWFPGRGDAAGREWTRKITACVRGVNDFPKRVYYTCNPGGGGTGIFKRLFIDRQFEPTRHGGIPLHSGAGDGQQGADGTAAGLYQAAAGAAAEAAPGLALWVRGISSRGNSSKNSAGGQAGRTSRPAGAARSS